MGRYILQRVLLSVPRRARDESGQVLMIAALLLPILLGMAAMAVDVGGYAAHRRQLQNAADAIALAASKDLPDASDAQTSAMLWANKNGIKWEDIDFQVVPVSTSNPNPKVVVKIERNHEFSFMKVLGIDNKDVGAKAAAIKTSPGGVAGLAPFGVTEAVQLAAEPGDIVTLKYDANNPKNGNFGPLRYDGSGSSIYLDTLKDGSDSVVCAEGVSTCTTDSPECTLSTCPTETGNKIGPTRDGIDYLLSNTSTHCDAFGEVFSGPTDGKYGLRAECNPWLAGSYASYRVLIIPIIDSFCNGTCSVTIKRFALFWLEGYNPTNCGSGSSCEVQGRFVNADVNINALVGIYDANSDLHFTRLVE